MKKRISLSLQLCYAMACVAVLGLCWGYVENPGRVLADWLMCLTCLLLVFPAMPVSLVLNIRVLRGMSQGKRGRWLAWTILSPVVYILLWLMVCCTFVSVTGGV